jgi:hypothetical protein
VLSCTFNVIHIHVFEVCMALSTSSHQGRQEKEVLDLVVQGLVRSPICDAFLVYI